MAVTAALVKELRERTGLGMMDCKNALVETDGDVELAIENLRKSGQAKAAKKAGRTAAEGAIAVKTSADGKLAIMVEVNSETDFVARDDNFKGFVDLIAARILESRETNIEVLMALPTEEGSEHSLEYTRERLVQKIGENIQVRRAVLLEAEGVVGSYLHGGKIGVLAALTGGNEELGKDVAMHVAATNPLVVNPDEVSAELLEKEKEIFAAQAKESGKPDAIIEKMIAGRIKKYLAEVSLVEQAFVKIPDTKVGKLVSDGGAKVDSFVRFEVGEGIEKEVVDFAEEVRAQVEGV
ncbi:MAG: translation elongation factor Ts [Gammaproteobacteria bacterium]|nr:translation elongation factor Ts [Gammaproteobacteria bacterium]